MLERILGDIHGILIVIILTIITLLYWKPNIFSNKEDEPKDDNS